MKSFEFDIFVNRRANGLYKLLTIIFELKLRAEG